jgi:hypothetical protein
MIMSASCNIAQCNLTFGIPPGLGWPGRPRGAPASPGRIGIRPIEAQPRRWSERGRTSVNVSKTV